MECSASAVWPSLTAHPQRCTSSIEDASSKGFIISPNAISSQGPNVQTQEPRLISYWNQHNIFFLETYGLIWQHTQLRNSISTPPGTTNGHPSCFTLQITNASFASRSFPEGRIIRPWAWHSADSEACGKPSEDPSSSLDSAIVRTWKDRQSSMPSQPLSTKQGQSCLSHLRRSVRSVRPNMERIWRQSLD